jgi:O-antigen biosynthesis protein
MTALSQNAKPFVSVVVPCHNGMNTVGECLSSLADQTYPKELYQVILVDNGSTDGTCELVRASFPWVTLIHSAEKGSGYARNAGVREALGELILSTDSDCVVDKAWMMNLVCAFEVAPPDVAAIGGKILPYSTKTVVERHQPAWPAQPDITCTPLNRHFAATPNAAYRAAIVRQIGGFDGAMGFDDTDLGMRLVKAGYRVEYTDHALVRHRNPAGIAELYRHRVRYGKFNFMLTQKHPDIFGDPTMAGSVRNLFWATVRRMMGDVLVKLPIALITGSKGRPRVWPVIDAAMALGNFKGFSQAAKNALAIR